MKKIFIQCILAPLLILPLATSCGDDDEGSSVSVSTRFLSAELGASVVLNLREYLEPPTWIFESEFRPNYAITVSGGKTLVTPEAFTAKAHYAGLLVIGDDSGYSLGPLVGSDNNPSDDESFTVANCVDVDLGQGITSSSTYECCGGTPYPQSNPKINYFHIYPAYITVKFTLTSGDSVHSNLQATHYIRLTFAPLTDATNTKGDLQYSTDGSTFYWCSASGCSHSTRPGSPYQHSTVASFSSTQEGNQTIADLGIGLESGHQEITVTEDQAKATATYNIDINLTDSISFDGDLTQTGTYNSVEKMVQIFDYAGFQPGSSNGTTFNATVTVSR